MVATTVLEIGTLRLVCNYDMYVDVQAITRLTSISNTVVATMFQEDDDKSPFATFCQTYTRPLHHPQDYRGARIIRILPWGENSQQNLTLEPMLPPIHDDGFAVFAYVFVKNYYALCMCIRKVLQHHVIVRPVYE